MAMQPPLIPHAPGKNRPAIGTSIRASMDVEAGPSRAAVGETRFLYTDGLASCIGIAVSGTYSAESLSDSENTRYDRFMGHYSLLNIEKYYPKFRAEVQAAKALGLQDLQVSVMTCDPASLTKRVGTESGLLSSGVEWRLMCHLRRLVGSDILSDDQPRIHWYQYAFHDDQQGAMALFSDRSVIAEQETDDRGPKFERWALQEKQWRFDGTPRVPPPNKQ
ncbi:hypothetical protein PG993_005772 [Apiospora rasikravindrae]|uniref:Uncharacterized protein n=1 Tax=Apiospora rasikravindrae TaxID=990691 RepID=A0ABR1TAC5_9PEZI